MGGYCGSAETLVCYECVCLTWKSLLGLGIPVGVTLLYLKRVFKEATVNDWMLMLMLSLLTWGTKTVTKEGVSHEPWYLYAVVLWTIMACTTDRIKNLPSIPMVGVFAFLSLAIADFGSMMYNRPEGMYGAPGGRGLIDGLIIKPMMAIGLMYLSYVLKVWPILPNKHRRGKVYDQRSKDFLLNVSPFYERPDEWDSQLKLLPKEETREGKKTVESAAA